MSDTPSGAWVVTSACNCGSPRIEAIFDNELDALRCAHGNRESWWVAAFMEWGTRV